MLSRSNLKELKTTIIGVVILIAAIVYPFYKEVSNTWIFGIMICIGIAMLFLPNTLIESLRKLLNTNSEKKF